MAKEAGPRPVWNYVALAFAIGVVVALYAPAAPLDPATTPPASAGNTITLDELEAMLTDAEPTPTTVTVETPDGPVTVVIPATTTTTTTSTPPPTTSTTTSTTTTTTQPPRRALPSVGDILDDLLAPTSTTLEGAGGGP